MRELIADVKWGLRYAFPVSAVLLVMGLGVALVRAPAAGVSFRLPEVLLSIVAYGVLGILAGVVVGLLRRRIHRPWGAGVAGMVITAFISIFFLGGLNGFATWTGQDALTTTLVALFFGAPVGVLSLREVARQGGLPQGEGSGEEGPKA